MKIDHTTRRIDTTYLNDPLLVGFDRIFDKMNAMNAVAQTAAKYPPYNIIKFDEDTYVIELAVAGFEEQDLDIELHDGVLSISADIGDKEDTATYIHKGIAARSFERKFTLADTIQVIGAQMYNGMLQIRLQNFIPEAKKPKKILIGRQLDPELLTE